MEPMMPNDGDESEMLRRMREMEGLPPEEKGLSRKTRIQIVAAGTAVLLLAALILFLAVGKAPEKQGKVVPAANRGLMQAESIREQKDQLDERNRRKGKEGDEEWERRFQALREQTRPASPANSMPEPVPMLPMSGKPGPDLADIKPSGDEGAPGTNWKSPLNFAGTGGGQAGPAPEKPMETKVNPTLESRMSEEYQRALAFNGSEQLVFTRDRGKENMVSGPSGKEPPKTGAGLTQKVIISAGQEMTAVLNESLNSDYPSVAKATLTSPAELAGSTLLLSYSLGNERVTTQVLKLILPPKQGERAREQSMAAVVKSGLPGLAGNVNHHWMAQVASGIASAGMTAGALAYAATNSNKDLGTAVLVAPLIEQSVQGVLRPVNYLGRERPVTVTVAAGTEFTLLVTEGFEVDL
jgi:type IV secretory pathway VirB10-like protein